MFEVEYENSVLTVYDVKIINGDTRFLVYHENEWSWLLGEWTKPYVGQ